jgi:hypothetical protein
LLCIHSQTRMINFFLFCAFIITLARFPMYVLNTLDNKAVECRMSHVLCLLNVLYSIQLAQSCFAVHAWGVSHIA